MLELYHNINSVCAQKVRIALEEKGQKAEEHVLTLRGDQNEPAYLKLNPSGVVPTLVHDGAPIVESSLILYYIDEIFPAPPLMPKAPLARLRVRLYSARRLSGALLISASQTSLGTFRKLGRKAVAKVRMVHALCKYSSISLLYMRTRNRGSGAFGISGGSGKTSSM